MDIQVQNEFYRLTVNTKGAEMQSLINRHTGQEYLWQADTQVWGRHAPNLFPIVGKLKNDQYRYQGKTYQMTQHGFARDSEFTLERETDHSLTFLLKDSPATWANYPFAFELRIKYSLINRLINVTYYVTNPSPDQPLIFAVGGHPGFKIPMTPELKFSDYYLRFKPSKSRIQIPLSPEGVDYEARTLAPTDVDWRIDHDVFKNDALIFQLNSANEVQIRSDKTPHMVTLDTRDAPFVGIWTAYPHEGDYICIEPWWGIADLTTATGELTEKFGMNTLAPQERFRAKYQISFA
ncbi:aldose 1-epimerase family protein [Lapidilactobacillus salsurivasis]